MQKRGLSLGLLLSVCLAACRGVHPTADSLSSLPALQTGSLSLARLPDASRFQKWPQFLLATGHPVDFLWGDDRELRELTVRGKNVTQRVVLETLTQDLDQLSTAAVTKTGTLAVMDVRGHLAVHSSAPEKDWHFEIDHPGRLGPIAVTNDRLYLLLQGPSAGAAAVEAYSFQGVKVGEWGTIPPDGLIQAVLKGGGIVACSDGEVYYSYLNSSRIMRIERNPLQGVRELGAKPPAFQVIPGDEVQAAYQKTKRGPVAPLIKLGLGASRVLALRCLDDKFLLWQVARPNGAGSDVYLFDRVRNQWQGSLFLRTGVLLDLDGNTLILGDLSEDQSFRLDFLKVSLPRQAQK